MGSHRLRAMALILASVLLLGGWVSPSSLTALEAFDRQEPDGVYRAGCHLVQAEPRSSPAMLDHTAQVLRKVWEETMAGTDVTGYFALIPGKHAFLGGGRPSLDYGGMAAYLEQKTPFLTHLDLTPTLSPEDYYAGDSHWRQEALPDTAALLAEAMGVTLETAFTRKTFTRDFRGIYQTDYDLPLPPEPLHYLTSPALEACTVSRMDLMGRPGEGVLYDFRKGREGYGYDFFLSGAQGLVTITNPHAAGDRDLVIFRDSFASSLAPLLATGYRTVTLVDLRYLPSWLVGDYLTFTDQDVLFLYSSLLVNNSLALR